MNTAARLFVFLAFIFSGLISFAQISNITVPTSGVSEYDVSTFTIYGGIAGDTNACPVDLGTCNNCSNDDMACNPRRITPSTELVIRFRTNTPNVEPELIFNTNDDVNEIRVTNNNGLASIAVDWADICSAMNSANCATDSTETFTITVGDETAEIRIEIMGNGLTNASDCDGSLTGTPSGYCNWTAIRGDEQVALTNGVALGQTSNLAGILVVYGDNFSAIDISDLTSGGSSANNEVLAWNDDSNQLVSESVTQLINGTFYDFKTAMIDEAGNFYNLFTSLDFSRPPATANGCDPGAGAEANVGPSPFDKCQFSARPNESNGLLDEDVNCFISTAAYGSSFSSKVETFREFRNLFMTNNKLGIFLIKKYYSIGPKLARPLYGNDMLRAATRTALYPLWAFATLSLKIGLGLSLFLVLSLVLFIILFFNKKRLFN